MRIVWGIVGVVIGFLVIKYSIAITDMFGKIEWAERHLGSGLAGTYSLYRIAGVVIIILSFLYMFGSLDAITGPLSPYFGG